MHKKLFASVIAAGLALAACGSDDDDADADDSAASSTAALEPTSTAAPARDLTGLDTSFGTDGVLPVAVSPTEHDRFITIAAGPGGQIYASGFTAVGEDHALSVTRFDSDGTIDATFGESGTATVNVAEGGGGAEVARGLVVLADGSVLMSGPFENDPAAEGDAAKDLDVTVVRLDATGALDPTFGKDGIATFDVGAGRSIDPDTYITDNAWGLTAREGGYALFAVTPNQGADRSDVDYAVVGITEDGALDTAFGEGGVVTVDLDASADSARNIHTMEDGALMATGYSRDADGVVSPVLIRLSADGVLDESFGEGGVANHVVLAGVTESYQVAAQGENFVLAGYGRDASSDEKVDMVVYRFLADGTFDTTFGTDGVTRLDLAGHDDRARNVTVLPDGKILAVGSGKLDAENVDAMVALFDADGAPIEAFGEDGHVLVDLGGPGDAFFGVTLTTDGSSLLVAGYMGADPEGTGNDDAVLARIAL